MTLREKIAEVSPADVCGCYEGGVNGCPGQYPETKGAPDGCMMILPDSLGYTMNRCDICWSREWKPEYADAGE